MKKLFSILSSLLIAFSLNASISYVTQQPSWIKVYNESGNLCHSVSSVNGKLIGYNSQIFILESTSWYYIYNEYGRIVKTLSKSSVGKILSVSGTGFVAQSGSWIYFYDNNGKIIETRQK